MLARPVVDESAANSKASATAGSTVAQSADALGPAVACALLYWGALEAGLALRFPDGAFAALWPANAVLLTVLLLVPARSWWLCVLAVIPAHYAAYWSSDMGAIRLAGQVVHNCALALAAAAFLRTRLRARHPFGRTRDLTVYLLVVVFGMPAVAAVGAPGTLLSIVDATDTRSAWTAWRFTYLANVINFLALVPAMTLWGIYGRRWLANGSARRWLEAAAIAAVAIGVCVLAFAGRSSPAALYALLVPLLWASVRFGVPGLTSLHFLMVLLTTALVTRADGSFHGLGLMEDVFDLQLFLVSLALPMLILSVLMDERAAAAREVRDSVEALRASEARLRLALRAGRMGAWDWDTRTNSVHWCAEHYSLMGYLPGDVQIKYRDWAKRVHPDDLPNAEAQMRAAIASRKDYRAEYRVLMPDGSVRWAESRAKPYYDANGECTRVMGLLIDVTERREMERALEASICELTRKERSLRESNERFELVLKATKDVIFDWNMLENTLWWSANGNGFLGRPPDDGRYDVGWWTDRIHPADRDRVVLELRTAIERRDEQWEVECRWYADVDAVVHIHVRGFIARDAQGRPLRMLGSLMDVTDRKRLEEANRSLAHAGRLTVAGELTASIAHEINQPLAAILSNAQAGLELLDGAVPPSGLLREILEDVREDGRRAGAVVSRLRSLLQNRTRENEALDFNEIVRDVVRLVRPEAARRAVRIETELAAIPTLYGDHVHLQQVLLNLLVNGMDAMAETPEARRRLIVRTTHGDGVVETRVIDAGCGIPAERLSHLFDSFYTTKQGGMGLGLSIARSIVHAHGGRIWGVNNSSGTGATFALALPVGPRSHPDRCRRVGTM